MNKYISKFQCDIHKLLADDFENLEKSNHTEKAFNPFMTEGVTI